VCGRIEKKKEKGQQKFRRAKSHKNIKKAETHG
jgi:hypothetical protein